MHHWKHFPKNPVVAKYIDCYWLIEKTAEDISADYPKLNPDPAAHLLLAPTEQAYRYQFSNTDITGNGCHLILPNTHSITMDHSQPFVILGVKFRVGALYSLAFTSPLPLVNSVVVGTNILPLDIRLLSVSTLLSDLKSQPKYLCAKLDETLLPWVEQAQDDMHSKLVHGVIALFDRTPIAKIGGAMNCSQRTVERAFRKVTGLTLKQYQSMTLLESLLEYLYQQEKDQINWADIALKFGFSDQPHLIRKLKTVVGTTPKDYLKHREMTIDVYGNFE